MTETFSPKTRRGILISINGIAAGLRNFALYRHTPLLHIEQ